MIDGAMSEPISKDEAWGKDRLVFSEILERGMQAYIDGLSPEVLEEAFMLHDKSVRCIDEGTPGGLHLAGSGILLSTPSQQEPLENVINELKAVGADGVYSHDGCGAAALYVENIIRPPHPEKAREYAIEWAKKMAERLGVEYKGHIDELARPKEFHNARIVYIDGTGRFDPYGIEEIPDGFIISRAILDKENAQEELSIAISIALGHHGFGHKFTQETPFIVAPIASSTGIKPELTLEKLEAEAREIVARFIDKGHNNIVIQGFEVKT